MGIFRVALDAIYRTEIATDATFQGVAKSMRVIDKSDGMDAPAGPRAAPRAKLPTVRPALTIRDHEVEANGLTISDLVGKRVVFNRNTWYVHATEPRPRPDGESESYLYIRSHK